MNFRENSPEIAGAPVNSAKSPSPFLHFKRASLADQAADALRTAIADRVWGHFLPSELELAARFQISRPSVHAALKILSNEGLVSIDKGRVAQIISQQPVSNAPPMVCVLSPLSRKTPGLADDPLLVELRGNLAAQGIAWDEAFDARLKGGGLASQLERLVSGRARTCWIMDATSEPIQRWFQASGLPALVLGSCHPGIELPCVDSDYRAIGWHAAGCITRLGHRNLAVVSPPNLLRGDIACRDGVMDYIATTNGKVSATEIRAAPHSESLRLRLERLMARRPHPTVIFTQLPEITISVLYLLQRAGYSVPGDVSLVSRDTHLLIEMGIPQLSRYKTPDARKVECVERIVQQLLAGRPVSSKPTLISPTFIAGETLRRPSDAPTD
jgi:hypothetical protein